MKDTPKTVWNPGRLDAKAFAMASGSVAEETPLSGFQRLHAESHPEGRSDPPPVRWQARGEMREAASGGPPDVWLHLAASAHVSLTCQRCLAPVDTALVIDRWFRFVADEAAAEAQDDDCEEDLLALEPRPNLRDVLEDELLMELPLVPMHDNCPTAVPLGSAAPADGIDQQASSRKNPFAALAKLKK